MALITREKPLRIKDVMEFTGYSRGHIYKLINLGKIPYHKPTHGRIFFRPREIEEFIYRCKCDADYELSEKADRVLNGEA